MSSSAECIHPENPPIALDMIRSEPWNPFSHLQQQQTGIYKPNHTPEARLTPSARFPSPKDTAINPDVIAILQPQISPMSCHDHGMRHQVHNQIIRDPAQRGRSCLHNAYPGNGAFLMPPSCPPLPNNWILMGRHQAATVVSGFNHDGRNQHGGLLTCVNYVLRRNFSRRVHLESGILANQNPY